MCDADLGVVSLVNHHGLVLQTQAIEEGILGMILQVPRLEHVVMKLLELNSQLDYTLIVILGHFPLPCCIVLSLLISMLYVVAPLYTKSRTSMMLQREPSQSSITVLAV